MLWKPGLRQVGVGAIAPEVDDQSIIFQGISQIWGNLKNFDIDGTMMSMVGLFPNPVDLFLE